MHWRYLKFVIPFARLFFLMFYFLPFSFHNKYQLLWSFHHFVLLIIDIIQVFRVHVYGHIWSQVQPGAVGAGDRGHQHLLRGARYSGARVAQPDPGFFFKVLIRIRFFTVFYLFQILATVDINKSFEQTKLQISLYTWAPISELPLYISNMISGVKCCVCPWKHRPLACYGPHCN